MKQTDRQTDMQSHRHNWSHYPCVGYHWCG